MPGHVPGIHVLLASVSKKDVMAGQKGVHARLRRAMPGHDGGEIVLTPDEERIKEEGAQIAADLGLPEPGARKPSFPSDAVAQTAAVFASAGRTGGLGRK